ncbi:MAG: tRNA-dihydrouridine synthase [Firmicutes bacterium]|nr:tRNA-dihydrouridine synthase [Bacillota bacterium]
MGPEEGPVGFQLFGCEPEILGYAVRLLSDPAHAKAADAEYEKRWTKAGGAAAVVKEADDTVGKEIAPAAGGAVANRPPIGARTAAGLKPPALFDLNAGCPVPKIVRNGEGSALLKDPQLLYDCVSAMCDASRRAAEMQAAPVSAGAASERSGAPASIPVTVKIRKGFELEDDCAVEIARAAEAAGAAAITVHGRTRQQFYEGGADWDVIARVKQAVRIPVIGNGDVMSGADAIRMMEETGCDGVMIARGALGNPWIFREACALWNTGTQETAGEEQPGSVDTVYHPPTDDERIDQLLHHLDLVCEDKGERVAVREMRKHVGWYIKGMRGATRIRRRINTASTVDEMKQVLCDLRHQ